MYNENVLKWCGPYYEDYDLIVEEDVIYDDSEEWYNEYDDGE